MKRIKKRTGVTMVELIIAISLLSVISMTAFGFIMFGANVVNESNSEIELQHSSRMVLYETSKIIRYASAVFTIPKSSFRANNLSSGWDYIGVIPTANGNEIVKYTYNSITNTHVPNILLRAQPGINFEFVFDKINPQDVDSLLQFTIEGFPQGSVDEFGQPRSALSVTSEVEARNSLQVIDLASEIDPAFAIAYRNDDRQKSVVGHVVMVLDKSGSMADNLQGWPNSVPSRINILKTEANALIDAFAQEDNIDIGLVPFATSANTANNLPVAFYNPQSHAANLRSIINSLNAVGGTNTGDGLRRAYWAFKTHNATVPVGVTAKNYLIILVDGVTTFASVVSNSNRSYYTVDGNVHEGYLDRTDPRDLNGQIAGIGSSLDAVGTGYVNTIGALLRTGNFAKSYVIGFSAVSSDLNSVNDIAAACGAPTDRVFRAGSADDLSQVFATIQQDIVNDLWYLQGPDL